MIIGNKDPRHGAGLPGCYVNRKFWTRLNLGQANQHAFKKKSG
jgi:hypothetical protein